PSLGLRQLLGGDPSARLRLLDALQDQPAALGVLARTLPKPGERLFLDRRAFGERLEMAAGLGGPLLPGCRFLGDGFDPLPPRLDIALDSVAVAPRLGEGFALGGERTAEPFHGIARGRRLAECGDALAQRRRLGLVVGDFGGEALQRVLDRDETRFLNRGLLRQLRALAPALSGNGLR